jgi:type IV pilus assembly protein PilE
MTADPLALAIFTAASLRSAHQKRRQATMAGNARGFTLIELMVTVAVIAILAAIAMPSYSDYVKRGKIPQATSNLASMRVKLEQYFQDTRTYVGSCAAGTVAPLPAADDFTYTCPAANLTATTFTVQAAGTGVMAGFTYTIDQNNTKTTTAVPSGWGTAPITCWVTKKGGGC